MEELLGETRSLCPVCLRKIGARKVAVNGNVYLDKSCPEHGSYRALIWRGADSYLDWGRRAEELGRPAVPLAKENLGCPYDCGLCPNHKAETCVSVMEVTHRCNLACPVCFASSDKARAYHPDLDVIAQMYRTVRDAAGRDTPVQLSGGEPTVRDDLAGIVVMGKAMGFQHVQVNTNGLRIAEDKAYLSDLADSGISAVYLQFDGTTDAVYRHTRGRELLQTKIRAIENCADARVGVVLVPTLVPGVNMQQVGEIVRFAKSWIPCVKGIHFQPISYFGRYPHAPADADRATIPDVIHALEDQTAGELKADNFTPRRRREAYCAFGSLFVLDENGGLLSLGQTPPSPPPAGRPARREKPLPYQQARKFVTQRWRWAEEDAGSQEAKPGSWESLFARARTHSFFISCMPFQDVWTVDLDRVERCCTHVVAPGGRLVPLCAFYLTGADGRRLHMTGG